MLSVGCGGLWWGGGIEFMCWSQFALHSNANTIMLVCSLSQGLSWPNICHNVIYAIYAIMSLHSSFHITYKCILVNRFRSIFINECVCISTENLYIYEYSTNLFVISVVVVVIDYADYSIRVEFGLHWIGFHM